MVRWWPARMSGGFLLLTACGGRTGLSLDAVRGVTMADAGATVDVMAPRDATVLPPPRCGEEVPVGAIRGKVERIDSRVAIDDAGNLYAMRLQNDRKGASLVSFDACLRPRWQVRLADWVPTSVPPRVMVDGNGDVWVLSSSEPKHVWRFANDGTPKVLGVDLGTDLVSFIGVPDEGGPVFVTGMFRDLRLKRVDGAGRLDAVVINDENQDLYGGECFALADTIGCADIAFDRASLQKLWVSQTTLLLDGTYRHMLPPASDGVSSYLVEFGISTYELRRRATRTGHDHFVTNIARTTMGSRDLLVGPPVISATGLVVVYLSAHREGLGPDGQLGAYGSDALEAWMFPAARTPRAADPIVNNEIYTVDASHVAGTDAIYLAVGESVYAVREDNGELLWKIDGLGDVNEPGTNLSPNGELYVRTLDGVLYAIRTESRGPAASPWPIPGGGYRLNRSD